MIRVCSICGKTYEVNPEDECFLGENMPICYACGDTLEALVNCDSARSYNAARRFLADQHRSATDAAVKAALGELLQSYPENAEEDEEEEDERLRDILHQTSSFSAASGNLLPYVVYQVTLKEKFLGTGSKNLHELEDVLNHFYQLGYRLHTLSTATSDGSKGFGGGDRIQATLVFEKVGLFS